jgi:hypothetical protein
LVIGAWSLIGHWDLVIRTAMPQAAKAVTFIPVCLIPSENLLKSTFPVYGMRVGRDIKPLAMKALLFFLLAYIFPMEMFPLIALYLVLFAVAVLITEQVQRSRRRRVIAVVIPVILRSENLPLTSHP